MKPTRDELELDLRTLELAIAVCDDESRRVPAKYDRAAFQAGACRCAFRLRRLKGDGACPDLVAVVVEERERLRSELCAARQDLDVAESRKSEAFRRLAAERDKAATHLREALDRERMSLVDFNAEVATLRAELFAARQDLGVEGKP